jgi:hypothetical protein
MKSLPAEVLYVLMFVAVVLFQYLMKRFGPQEQQDPVQQEGLPPTPEEASEAPATRAVSAVSGNQFGYSGRDEAPRASTAPPRRRFSRKSLMGSRRDVQNSVVIATILGPCRAFEPHDVR